MNVFSQRPRNNWNDTDPSTWDTMPSSGLFSAYPYQNQTLNETFSSYSSVRDFYFVGTRDDSTQLPIFRPGTLVEMETRTPGHVKIMQPVGTKLDSTFWTFAHVVWIPREMRDLGWVDGANHVLSKPLAQFVFSFDAQPSNEVKRRIHFDSQGQYLDQSERFKDGLVDVPGFSGYQIVLEKLVFRTEVSAGATDFALMNPTLTLVGSSIVLPGWRNVIQAMLPGGHVPDIYGWFQANAGRLAGLPRLHYRTEVRVSPPNAPGFPGAVTMPTDFPEVWPGDARVDWTDKVHPEIIPAYRRSVGQSSILAPNSAAGCLLEVTIDQG